MQMKFTSSDRQSKFLRVLSRFLGYSQKLDECETLVFYSTCVSHYHVSSVNYGCM